MRHKIVLSSFIFALLSPAPAALAQGECGLQTDPGNPETVTCDPQDYPTGITYDSLGDLTLEVPDDAVDFTVNDAGVNVSNGNAGDNLFWDSSAYISGEIIGTDGAVLDYLSADGDIDITVGGPIKGFFDDDSSATHAIRAEATGTGNVSVTTLGNVNSRGSFLDPDPSGSGIEALTAGGNITIETGDVTTGWGAGAQGIHASSSAGGSIDIDTDGRVTSIDDATHAILAETTGAGAISMTISGVNGIGATGIEAISGSGDITITSTGEVGGSDGLVAETGGAGAINLNLSRVEGRSGGTALRAESGSGDITIAVGSMGGFNGTDGIVTQTDGRTTVDTGSIIGRNWDRAGGFGLDISVRSLGAGDVIFNMSGASTKVGETAKMTAPFDFSGLTGDVTLNFDSGSLWGLTNPDAAVNFAGGLAASVFSGGDMTVNIDAGAYVATPVGESKTSADLETDRYVVDFGGGSNVFNNAGSILVGPWSSWNRLIGDRPSGSLRVDREGEIRFEGLAEFNHSGVIWLGTGLLRDLFNDDTVLLGLTDTWPDDIFAVPGAAYVGQGGVVMMDADLNSLGQSACNADQRNAEGDLLNDCLNIRGDSASATGTTLVHINQMIPGDRGAYNPDGNVVVDLAGSDPANTDPNAFLLSPTSEQYSPAFGGIIDKGVFFYSIAWDPDTQQFKLFGLPSSGSQQAPLLGQVANGLWRNATDAWFDRRVDQRDVDNVANLGSGIWFRSAKVSGDRDLPTPIIGGGRIFDFDNSYTQDDTTATFGWDIVARNTGDMAWVAGGMLGYARSQVEFDDSPNTIDLEGMHAGLYANLTWNDFYLDLALNKTWLDAYQDVPAMNLRPEGTVIETEADSVGGQIEAGWRWRMGNLSIEPLLGYTHVTTKVDDIEIPADDELRFGAEVAFEEPTSQRGSVGLRVRLAGIPSFAPTSVGLTARAIEEFDGDSEATIANVGPIDTPVTDTFDGTFGQITGDVSITNAAKTVAGFVKVDGTFHDDYESLGVSAGFRYQW